MERKRTCIGYQSKLQLQLLATWICVQRKTKRPTYLGEEQNLWIIFGSSICKVGYCIRDKWDQFYKLNFLVDAIYSQLSWLVKTVLIFQNGKSQFGKLNVVLELWKKYKIRFACIISTTFSIWSKHAFICIMQCVFIILRMVKILKW